MLMLMLILLLGGIVGSEAHDTTVFKPEHIFFTSSGRICQTLQVNDRKISLALTSLQGNMAKKLLGPGDISHTKSVTRPPFMFRDLKHFTGGEHQPLNMDEVMQTLTEPKVSSMATSSNNGLPNPTCKHS